MHDLHAHLTGSITGGSLFDMIYESRLYLSNKEKINSLTEPFDIRLSDRISQIGYSAREEFARLYTCRPNGKKRFEEVMQRFVLISYVLESDPMMRERTGEIVGRDIKKAGTTYVEWRIDPFSATKTQTAEEGSEKLLEFYDGLKRSPLDFRFTIGLAKHRYRNGSGTDHERVRFAAEQSRKLLDICDELPIVGLDAVNKEDVPIRDLKPFFSLSDSYNLGISPHVGECTSNSLEENLDTVLDALEMGASRMGHAIVAYMPLETYLGNSDAYGRVYDGGRIEKLSRKQGDVLAAIKESGAVIEVCPTSNMAAHLGLKDIKKHPIDRLLSENIPFVVCSDDCGVFGSPLKKEISLLARAKNLDVGKLEAAAEKYSFKNLG